MQVGGFDVDDEWVSKLHKHLWELQGIWKGLKEYVDVLAKYGIRIPLWTWVSFAQVMGIVIKISRVVQLSKLWYGNNFLNIVHYFEIAAFDTSAKLFRAVTEKNNFVQSYVDKMNDLDVDLLLFPGALVPATKQVK